MQSEEVLVSMRSIATSQKVMVQSLNFIAVHHDSRRDPFLFDMMLESGTTIQTPTDRIIGPSISHQYADSWFLSQHLEIKQHTTANENNHISYLKIVSCRHFCHIPSLKAMGNLLGIFEVYFCYYP